MRLFILLFLSIVSLTSVSHAFIFDLIKDGVDAVSDATDKVTDSWFKKTMIAKTIESIGHLKKNYDESRTFYEEMKYISNNPNSLSDYAAKRFEDRGRGLMNNRYTDITRQYISAQDDPGKLGQFQNHASQYIQDTLDFSKKVLAENKKREDDFYNKVVPGSSKNDKADVEKAKLQGDLLMAESMISIEKTTAKSLQVMTALYDHMTKSDRESFDREKQFTEEITNLKKHLLDGQGKQRKTSLEVLDSILK